MDILLNNQFDRHTTFLHCPLYVAHWPYYSRPTTIRKLKWIHRTFSKGIANSNNNQIKWNFIINISIVQNMQGSALSPTINCNNSLKYILITNWNDTSTIQNPQTIKTNHFAICNMQRVKGLSQSFNFYHKFNSNARRWLVCFVAIDDHKQKHKYFWVFFYYLLLLINALSRVHIVFIITIIENETNHQQYVRCQ